MRSGFALRGRFALRYEDCRKNPVKFFQSWPTLFALSSRPEPVPDLFRDAGITFCTVLIAFPYYYKFYLALKFFYFVFTKRSVYASWNEVAFLRIFLRIFDARCLRR